VGCAKTSRAEQSRRHVEAKHSETTDVFFVAPIDDEEHLLFLCESTKDIRLRFAGLPMSSLRNFMQCEDVGSVARFVHECMERVDNSHTG
jgi:hypothetical protein